MKAILLGCKERSEFKGQNSNSGAPPASADVGTGVCLAHFFLGELEKPRIPLVCLGHPYLHFAHQNGVLDPSAYVSWHFLHICSVPSTVGEERVGGNVMKIAFKKRKEKKLMELSLLLALTQPWGHP